MYVGVGMGLVLLLASAGLIAYLGDLIGRRIGRKRLTLFGLRPKNTAILITVATGIAIATVTMGIIFGVSRDLRVRIFGYERTVGNLRREAASSATAAARSKGELATAEKDLVVQRGRAAAEQRAAEAAQKARLEAERSLAAAQARYQQAVAQLARAQRQVRAAQARVQAAAHQVAALTAQQARLAHEVGDLRQQKAQVIKALDQASKELASAQEQLGNAERILSEQYKKVEAVKAEAALIAEGTRQDMERILDATAGTVLYAAGEELDRDLVRATTLENTTTTVQRLVSRINEKARARGAGEYDKERLPGIVAVAIGRGAENKTLRPEDYLPAVVRFLVAEGRPAWVRAQVVANCFGGRPLFYTFRLYPDRIAFRAGTEVARAEMDGAQNELTIVDALRTFVVSQVRPATEAAGMLPPLSGTNELGPAVWMPALHQIQGVGGPAEVSAVAIRDIGVGDSLANAIEFRVTAKP